MNLPPPHPIRPALGAHPREWVRFYALSWREAMMLVRGLKDRNVKSIYRRRLASTMLFKACTWRARRNRIEEGHAGRLEHLRSRRNGVCTV